MCSGKIWHFGGFNETTKFKSTITHVCTQSIGSWLKITQNLQIRQIPNFAAVCMAVMVLNTTQTIAKRSHELP